MLALRVIEHLDIIEHIPSSLVTCFVNPAPNPLSFEQIEEAFNDIVVVQNLFPMACFVGYERSLRQFTVGFGGPRYGIAIDLKTETRQITNRQRAILGHQVRP